MKKDRGSMIHIMPAIFTIMAVSIILIFYIGWSANLNRKDAVRQIGRTYILAMETEGYLTSSLESRLRSDLTSKGLGNIDLSGTTVSEIGYGNTIYLCIKGDLRVETYTMAGVFRISRNSTTIPIEIKLESTAKN